MKTLFDSLTPKMRHLVLLIIVYIGFVSLGLPDTILGVAWNSMYREFHEPIYYAGFITTLLTIFSAISAFFSAAILRKTGTGGLLVICGYMTGCALLGYAFSPAYWGLLLFAVPLGFGQGAIDTGMNFFVAKHYTSRDMSWLHCCWGLGASLGPFLVTLILARGFSWRWGYGFVSLIQIGLATLFLFTLSLWNESKENGKADKQTECAMSGKVRYSLRLFCCPLMFFLYCGIEYSMGLWSFAFLTGCRGISESTAGFAVAGYWGMLTVGRFLIGCIANRVGNLMLVRLSMAAGIAGGLLLMIPGIPVLALCATGLIGFAFSTFYPSMMHAAPERFHDDATASTAIGYQGGAAMLGSAMIPTAFGFLAARTTFNLLPLCVILFTALIFLLQIKVDGWKFKSSEQTTGDAR